MFERIVIGYDGSNGAERALGKAVELAKLCNAHLMILTVYRHHSMLEASVSMVRGKLDPGGNLDEQMREAAREAAEQGKQAALAAGVEKVSAFIKSGPPARTLVGFAKKRDCDLIVVGSRGMGATESYLLGSVSHKVTGLADMPVLVF